MTGNGNEPDTTHASVGQFDDIDETILSMLEKDGRAFDFQLFRVRRSFRSNARQHYGAGR